MAVVGFNYTKLLAERKKGPEGEGKVNISNNVSLTDVERQDLSFQEGQEALQIKFRYVSSYKPEVADIKIEGKLVYVDEDSKVDELLDKWEEDRQLPKDVSREVINYILNKCNVQTIVMSRDINIPSPIPLPKVEEDSE